MLGIDFMQQYLTSLTVAVAYSAVSGILLLLGITVLRWAYESRTMAQCILRNCLGVLLLSSAFGFLAAAVTQLEVLSK